MGVIEGESLMPIRRRHNNRAWGAIAVEGGWVGGGGGGGGGALICTYSHQCMGSH